MADCLYLVSSSSSREYVADCLEALALPRGMIHHFRYRGRWIDEEICSELKPEPGRLPDKLKDIDVVVVYLYQEQSGGSWKVEEGAYLPLRCGRLVEAYLDGEVAHFYFEVGDYVRSAEGDLSARKLLNDNVKFIRKSGERSYAHLATGVAISAGVDNDASAFQGFVDRAYIPGEWRTRSLGSAPMDVTYDVVFMRVDGVFRERGETLERLPVRARRLTGNPFGEYELESGATYHIKVITYLRDLLPALLPGQGRARLKLIFDPEVLKPAGVTSFAISSAYDLHYWSVLASSSVDRRSAVTVVCEPRGSDKEEGFLRRELLCPEISLPISVIRSQSSSTA
jgi:hypothetical protein